MQAVVDKALPMPDALERAAVAWAAAVAIPAAVIDCPPVVATVAAAALVHPLVRWLVAAVSSAVLMAAVGLKVSAAAVSAQAESALLSEFRQDFFLVSSRSFQDRMWPTLHSPDAVHRSDKNSAHRLERFSGMTGSVSSLIYLSTWNPQGPNLLATEYCCNKLHS